MAPSSSCSLVSRLWANWASVAEASLPAPLRLVLVIYLSVGLDQYFLTLNPLLLISGSGVLTFELSNFSVIAFASSSLLFKLTCSF